MLQAALARQAMGSMPADKRRNGVMASQATEDQVWQATAKIREVLQVSGLAEAFGLPPQPAAAQPTAWASEAAKQDARAAQQAAAGAKQASTQAAAMKRQAFRATEQAAAEAATKLLQEEAEAVQATQRSRQKAADKKARQKQRKQVLPLHHVTVPDALQIAS